jgi:hypothetical protein
LDIAVRHGEIPDLLLIPQNEAEHGVISILDLTLTLLPALQLGQGVLGLALLACSMGQSGETLRDQIIMGAGGSA